MTFKTERLRTLLFAAAAAVWSAGTGACIADNSIGVDNGIKNGGAADGTTRVQYVSLSYDPDGDQLIAATTTGVRVFDADDGNTLQSIPMNAAFQAVRAGAVTAVSDASRIAIFDDTGNLLRTIFPAGAPVLGGSFMMDLSPDGTMVASGDILGHLRLFRTSSGAELSMLAWPEAEYIPFLGVRFSPDGAYLAAANDSDIGTRIWRLEDGAVWADIPGFGGFGAGLQFTPAGELARMGNDGVDVFAVPAGTKIASYPHAGGALAFSADGSLLAVYRPEGEPPGDAVIRVIDRATGAEAVRLFDDPRTRPADTGPKPRVVAALTFAGPDLVAVAWDDGRLAAFRLSDGSRLWSRLDSD